MPTRLRTLLLCLIASLFMASGIARAAPLPAGEVPPCHAMAGMVDHQSPKQKPAHPDMVAMNCCLGCLPSTAGAVTLPARVQRPVAVDYAPGDARLDGLALAPELDPPRAAWS